MTPSIKLLPFLLLPALVAGETFARELPAAIGYVRSVEGDAFYGSRGHSNAAHVGQAILPGGTLSTGPRGTLGVILDDGTRLSLGPASELRLDKFAFEPARGEMRVDLWLERGMLALGAGEVARLAPGQLRLETPRGSVGVLGTAQVLVRVAP